MSLQQKAIRGIIWSALQNWGSLAGSLLVFFVLARLLPAEALGLVAIAQVAVAFFQVFLQRSFTEFLIQCKSLQDAHLNTAFWLNLGISILLMTIVWMIAPGVSTSFHQPQLAPILLGFSVLLPMMALSQIQQVLLERQLNFKAIALRQLAGTWAGGVVGVGMALTGWGVWSLVAQQLVQEGIGTIVLWRSSSWRPRFQVSRSHGRELWDFGIPLLGFNFINFLNTRSDDLLIGYFLGTAALGYYSIAYRILGVMQQLLVQTSKQVALPIFARLQENLVEFRQAFYQATYWTSLVAFPIFLAVVVLAPELVLILFGAQWAPAIPVLQVLAIAGIFQSVSFFKSSVFVAMGRPSWSLWLSCLTVVLNLLGFAIAVRWGIVAVAAAFVIRGYLVFPVGQWAVSRLLHTPLFTYLKQFGVPLCSSLLMIVVMVFVRNTLLQLNLIPVLIVLFCSLIGFLVYVEMIRILSPKSFQEIVALLQLAVARIKIKPSNS
jgi:O-antigen/teichoic acid export membrane protein